MQLVDKTRNVRLLLIAVAVVIAVTSLLTSNLLFRDLKAAESNNMEVWAEAIKSVNTADENTDLSLVLKVINGNSNIPVIVLRKDGTVDSYRNIETPQSPDSLAAVARAAAAMKAKGNVIRVYLDMGGAAGAVPDAGLTAGEADTSADAPSVMVLPVKQNAGGDYMEICYDESFMLKRLSWYPYIQLAVVVIFVLIAIFALLAATRAEQNKVWVGLSKETAHQLGTPISSLLAWCEVLKETYPGDAMLPEMMKDVRRLELIAERFSKIGSVPEPKEADLCEILRRTADYMDRRTSSKVVITLAKPEEPVRVSLIAPLFEWVVENLCKNAVDAMGGSGRIDIRLADEGRAVSVEVGDTGKGIPKQYFKSVFKPGYTTKKRGWGLGLSLAKRIVEEYHRGHIFVKSSTIGKGTTFRIEIPKG